MIISNGNRDDPDYDYFNMKNKMDDLNTDIITDDLNSDTYTDDLISDTYTDDLNCDTNTHDLISDTDIDDLNIDTKTDDLNNDTPIVDNNTDLTIDYCDSVTNVNQYTEIEKMKLKPKIDKINHIEFKSNIIAQILISPLFSIFFLPLSILIINIINKHHLKGNLSFSEKSLTEIS